MILGKLAFLIPLLLLSSDQILTCACEPLSQEEQFILKAESAFQVAQGEADRVRFVVELYRSIPKDVPIVDSGSLTKLPAPQVVLKNIIVSPNPACPNSALRETIHLTTNALLSVDINEDCKTDLFLQVARSKEVKDITKRTKRFSVLVRVYSSAVEPNINSLGTKSIFLRSPFGHKEDLEPLSILYKKERLEPLAVLKSDLSY